MGIVLSFLNVCKHYQTFVDFHHAINGNWFLYFYFLFKFLIKSLKSKPRFDLYDIDIEGDPYAIGLLPPPLEWSYECPQKNRFENLLIYGSNTSHGGQCLVIEIKWRPQNRNQINGSVRLLFRDENQLVYELNENDLLTIESNTQLRHYRIAGLSIQVLNPYRKLRIRFRGLLRRRDTNELIYSRLRFFWSPLSNIFDFENDFNNKFNAKELSALAINKFETEDRHEQWGQLHGNVQIGDQISKEVFLWGNKSKQYLNNDFRRKVTRIYGYNSKGFCFHMGTVRSTENYRLRYGYVGFGTGSVFPVSAISSSFDEMQSIGKNETPINKIKLEIKEQNREFDVEIGDKIEEFGDLVIREFKLNGHNGKCLVINEEFNERISDLLDKDIDDRIPQDLVIPISDVRAKNVWLSGGKGSSLSALTQMAANSESKLTVPKGLIVTTNAYKLILDESELISSEIDDLEKVAWSEKRENLQKCCQEVSDKFGKQEMPQKLVEIIQDHLSKTFGNDYQSIRFAVRSSALSEDSGEMSSAGQMTTILGVKSLAAITRAVMKCWSSQFSYIAVEYKRGYGQEINSPMAVVIQEMVECDSAGVMLTCDPITGDERNLLITANYGIGESVVSAMAEPDTIRLRVNIEANSLLSKRYVKDIDSIEIGSKLKSIVLNDNNESGTKGQINSNNKECCLSEDQCRQLAEVGLEVHRKYGDPRDIEWGIKDNQIYLLQSRPVTNLDNWTEWEIMHDIDSGQQSEREYFSRANLGEVFPGATSHLCLSWLTCVWGATGFRMYRKMFNLPKKEYSPYYNRGGGTVSNHYFFLLKTGTFPLVGDSKSTISKSIQIGIFGHDFDGEEWVEMLSDSADKAPKKNIPLSLKLWLFFGSFKYFLTPGPTLRQAKEKMSHMDLFRGKLDFTAKDMFNAVLEGYDWNSVIGYAHGKVTLCSMMYNMLLLQILKKNNPDKDIDCYTDFSLLVSSASEVVSAQVPNLLGDIANSIENRHKFKAMSDEKALKYLIYSETEASLKFRRFLQEYGHRGYKEFDPLALQWGDYPITVIKFIKTMINGDQRVRRTKRNQSVDQIISSLKCSLDKKWKFLLKYLVIPWCQTGVMLREKSKHVYTWSNHIYRKGFWRLAKQMVCEGRLPEPDLLFHMNIHEIQILLNERDPTIISRARLRRKFHSIKENFKFAETSIGPQIRPRNEKSEEFEIAGKGELTRMKGTPVSSGKIRGRCCVAMSLEEAQNLQSGDILITYSTDICWSPYFPMLSGLATEIGGLISHGAVIAREYGLPCLVGVEGAHRLFRTGDTVVIDSDIGEIYKIDSQI